MGSYTVETVILYYFVFVLPLLSLSFPVAVYFFIPFSFFSCLSLSLCKYTGYFPLSTLSLSFGALYWPVLLKHGGEDRTVPLPLSHISSLHPFHPVHSPPPFPSQPRRGSGESKLSSCAILLLHDLEDGQCTHTQPHTDTRRHTSTHINIPLHSQGRQMYLSFS